MKQKNDLTDKLAAYKYYETKRRKIRLCHLKLQS